jgi:hypothetical protein
VAYDEDYLGASLNDRADDAAKAGDAALIAIVRQHAEASSLAPNHFSSYKFAKNASNHRGRTAPTRSRFHLLRKCYGALVADLWSRRGATTKGRQKAGRCHRGAFPGRHCGKC